LFKEERIVDYSGVSVSVPKPCWLTKLFQFTDASASF